MDAKLAFWTWALLDMVAMAGFAALGIRRVRARAIASHRRAMLTAVALVGAFVASYALKLVFLGREALQTWERGYLNVLRFHESCIAVMLVAGAIALWLALHHGIASGGGDAKTLRRHRRAGWTAFLAALLGVCSAGAVLFGMYQRA